jgi:hypothetical protein
VYKRKRKKLDRDRVTRSCGCWSLCCKYRLRYTLPPLLQKVRKIVVHPGVKPEDDLRVCYYYSCVVLVTQTCSGVNIEDDLDVCCCLGAMFSAIKINCRHYTSVASLRVWQICMLLIVSVVSCLLIS